MYDETILFEKLFLILQQYISKTIGPCHKHKMKQ